MDIKIGDVVKISNACCCSEIRGNVGVVRGFEQRVDGLWYLVDIYGIRSPRPDGRWLLLERSVEKFLSGPTIRHISSWRDGFDPTTYIIDEMHLWPRRNPFIREENEMKNDSLESILKAAFEIKDVIFNDPATIIKWADGTKTVVKANGSDGYDPEKGLAMAIAKKALGNKYSYYDTFQKWLPDESENIEASDIAQALKIGINSIYGRKGVKIQNDVSGIFGPPIGKRVRLARNITTTLLSDLFRRHGIVPGATGTVMGYEAGGILIKFDGALSSNREDGLWWVVGRWLEPCLEGESPKLMSTREYVKKNYPNRVREVFTGGVHGCPCDYIFTPEGTRLKACVDCGNCRDCFDQLIPLGSMDRNTKKSVY